MRLSAVSRPSLASPIPLQDALLTIYGRPKPLGALIGAMLRGDLPFTINNAVGKLLDAVSVERSSIPSLGTMVSLPTENLPVSDRITQREALEMLNAHSMCRAVNMLESTGRNPITYSLNEVQRLGWKGASVLEVATVTGRSLSSVFHLIKSQKIETVADGLWNRRQVKNLIADCRA